MDNDNVVMTIIVEPRKSESLTILFKEGSQLGNTTTYELDLDEVDIDWLTTTLQNIKKLRREKVGKVTFEHILGNEEE
jgi:hypothetical protein